MVYIRSDIPCRRVTDYETMSVELLALSVVNNSRTTNVLPHCRSSTQPFCLLFILHTSPEVYGLRVDNLTCVQQSTEHG